MIGFNSQLVPHTKSGFSPQREFCRGEALFAADRREVVSKKCPAAGRIDRVKIQAISENNPVGIWSKHYRPGRHSEHERRRASFQQGYLGRMGRALV